jgi:ATP-dependent helicase HepA
VALAEDFADSSLQRFLEQPSFNAGVLKTMLASATERADERGRVLQSAALEKANAALTADLQRLRDLQKINDHVRPAEIELVEKQLEHTRAAIDLARLRLDSLRLILEGPRAPGEG